MGQGSTSQSVEGTGRTDLWLRLGAVLIGIFASLFIPVFGSAMSVGFAVYAFYRRWWITGAICLAAGVAGIVILIMAFPPYTGSTGV